MKELIHIRHQQGSTVSAEEKENLLLARFASFPSLVVALSGGADSAYLAWAAHRALGAQALCVTALSPSYSAHDRAVVEEFVNKLGVRHEFIETHEMDNPAYRANAADRCYFCKDELFSALDELAHARGFAIVAYGGNGPLHAVSAALELGVHLVVVPPSPGVFSAFGLLAADPSQHAARSFLRVSSELTPDELEAAYRELEQRDAKIRRLVEGSGRSAGSAVRVVP